MEKENVEYEKTDAKKMNNTKKYKYSKNMIEKN